MNAFLIQMYRKYESTRIKRVDKAKFERILAKLVYESGYDKDWWMGEIARAVQIDEYCNAGRGQQWARPGWKRSWDR